MPPSKMGFRPGTLVTLDNALKMLMVKSPNDVAVTIAEGIAGSVEAFADEMNVYAARLGLHESHFVNPNGLPDPSHVSSARDMAMIARALLRDFPEEHVCSASATWRSEASSSTTTMACSGAIRASTA